MGCCEPPRPFCPECGHTGDFEVPARLTVAPSGSLAKAAEATGAVTATPDEWVCPECGHVGITCP